MRTDKHGVFRAPREIVISLFALISFTAIPGSAQPPQFFDELALRVNLDDQLWVHDASGATIKGRLTRVTRDAITILTDTGEKRFTSDAVRAVDVGGHSLGKSAVIGAVAFAMLGVVAATRHRNTGASPPGAAAIGAGLGATIGSVVPTRRTIFRASASDTSVLPVRNAEGAEPDLFDALAPRINLDDRIRVQDQSGVRTTGRLSRLTADGIAIQTDAGEKRFTADALREVAVRRSPVRLLTLIGAGAGIAAGALTECRAELHPECPDALVILGGLGAGGGALTGALIQRTTTVYARQGKMAVVVPAIGRDTVGVQTGVYW
jgi:hypothetical protein